MADQMCCFIPEENYEEAKAATTHEAVGALSCQERAEWVIIYGSSPDDHTEACTAHVGALLTDADEHRIYPHPQTIETEPARTASIGCPICGSYSHLAVGHDSAVRGLANG